MFEIPKTLPPFDQISQVYPEVPGNSIERKLRDVFEPVMTSSQYHSQFLQQLSKAFTTLVPSKGKYLPKFATFHFFLSKIIPA